MTAEEQQAVAQLTALDYSITPVQIGNPGHEEIRVLVQIGTRIGVTSQYLLTQEAARMLSKAIKDGVERAEVTLVKPQSVIANA